MTNKEKITGVPIEDDALDKVAGGVISVERLDLERDAADDAQCSPEEMRKLINQVAGEIAYLNYVIPYRREYDRERER